jgi:hypothetical protein
MKIGIQKTVDVVAKELRIHMKVVDGFECAIYDQDGQQIGDDYEGYVPGFMPGEHYGDYLILNIDLDSGKITNWMPPSKEEIEEFINESEDD